MKGCNLHVWIGLSLILGSSALAENHRAKGLSRLIEGPRYHLEVANYFLRTELLERASPSFRAAFLNTLNRPGQSGKELDRALTSLVNRHPLEPSRIRKAYKAARAEKLFRILLSHGRNPKSYLDIGSGDGMLASRMAREWGLSKENCHAIDVMKYTEQKNLTYHQYESGEGVRIPTLRSNSIELATMIMVLHHATNPEGLLKEAFRVLQPGGRLIIRDSDVNSEAVKARNMGLDALFSIVFKESDDYPLAYGYRDRIGWRRLFEKCGFSVKYTAAYDRDHTAFCPYHWVLEKPGRDDARAGRPSPTHRAQ
jgi:2-polyprenyl-3-methyl-5-hydroxy-6-metoxy-1,4-benzoquinol methylase